MATPETASYFQHAIGKVALNGVERDASEFDHVFIQTQGEEDNHMAGMYVFRGRPEDTIFNTELFLKLMETMTENGYPVHANLRRVADCDIDAYNQLVETYIKSRADGLDDELDKLLGGEKGS